MVDFDMANHTKSGRRKSGGRSGGRRSGGGSRLGRGSFGRSKERHAKPERHEIVCDECGSKCEVPFKPTPGKPIYCDACFKKKDNSSGVSVEEIEKINDKLDKIMKALKIKD